MHTYSASIAIDGWKPFKIRKNQTLETGKCRLKLELNPTKPLRLPEVTVIVLLVGPLKKEHEEIPSWIFGPFHDVLEKPDKIPKNGRLEAKTVHSPTG